METIPLKLSKQHTVKQIVLFLSSCLFLLFADYSLAMQRNLAISTEGLIVYSQDFGLYEVELMTVDDIQTLYAEHNIAVKGKVTSSPRFGVNSEVWQDGIWQTIECDTTLVDRYIVECVKDNAISLSTYDWVEWIGLMLPETIYEEQTPSVVSQDFGLYEVELMTVDDIQTLYAEHNIAVKGKVTSSPRFGVNSEVWQDGIWQTIECDTTLVDRYIVECVKDNAISLSTYDWVEWIGLMLPETIYEEQTPSVVALRSIGIDSLVNEGGDYENAQFIADHTDLYDTWWYQGNLVDEIHSIRPDLKVIIYRNVRAVYNTGGETSQWLLKDSSGNYIYSLAYPGKYFLCDIGNTEYQDYVANWVKNQCDEHGFDGVFADWGIDAGAGLTYGLSGHAINPRTGEPYTREEWVEGTLAIAQKIKAKIGSKLYVGNGIHDGNKWFYARDTYMRFLNLPIDGLMAEGLFTPTMSEDSWKKSLDFMVWLQDNFLARRSNGVFLPVCDLRGATNEQVKYLFCSSLLGIKDFSKNYLWMTRVTCSSYTQSLFEIDLGIPEGDYYLVGETRIYAREFTKARVYVNPTSSTYTVEVNGESLTILPRTGEIVSLSPD